MRFPFRSANPAMEASFPTSEDTPHTPVPTITMGLPSSRFSQPWLVPV